MYSSANYDKVNKHVAETQHSRCQLCATTKAQFLPKVSIYFPILYDFTI